MRYLALVPAAAMVFGILLGHGLSMRERSAQAPVPAAQGSPDASVTPSWAASASDDLGLSGVLEAVDGGGGASVGLIMALPSPAPTDVVATVEDVADSNLPQPSVTVVTQALEAQVDEQRPSKPQGAGSSPAEGFNDLEAAIEAAFATSEWATAYRVAMCESGGDTTVVGSYGERGAWQIRPEYWGAVPADIYGQAEQAAEVVAEAGWSQWSCY